MKIIEFPKNNEYSKNKKIFVLGKFESIHLGHKELLYKAKEISQRKNLELGIMIFSEKEKENLYSLEERIKFLSEFSPDYIMIFHPNKKNFSYSKNFFEDLLKKINVSDLVVGYDYFYGKNREGKAIDLSSKFELTIIDEVKKDDLIVSTRNLKDSIKNADFLTYRKIMNHYFFYKGIVIKGKGMGKQLNMPTINVVFPKYKIEIPHGIYYSYVIYNGTRYQSLTSVSTNPTFKEKKTAYETYIFDFSKEVYGEEVYVEIIEKFRNPIMFESIDLLVEQLEKDKIKGKRYFKEKKG